jgi:methyl-accepting chemotaxis protein
MNISKKLTLSLAIAGVATCAFFIIYIHSIGTRRVLDEAKAKANEMIQRSAQMFMVSTVKFDQAYNNEKNLAMKKAIHADWNRTITAVDEAVIHDFGAENPRVRLIGDLNITGIKPMGSASIAIQIPFEEKALKEFMTGKTKVEEQSGDVYRLAVPLVNNMHAGCADCHEIKRDGNIVMGSVNAYVPMAKMMAAARSEAMTTTFCIAVALLGLIIFIGVFMQRSIIKPIERTITLLGNSSDQLKESSKQVTAASQTLAEGASEQAASLEETSSSLEEISSMTKRNEENSQHAKELANQARHAADVGTSDMQAMSQAMNDIKVSSDDIAKIIKTIDEIAFQTNLLALNAAVEAARAGEAGMGFAVVADEVRSLAQRAAQAAKETSAKIEGAIAKSQQGVEVSAKVAQGLQEIVNKVRQVDELVAEVAVASKEQTQGIGQVNNAISEMDKVTQSTAANAEESAAAAEELNAQAQSLKDSVAELQKLVGNAEVERHSVSVETNAKPALTTKPLRRSGFNSKSAANGNGQCSPKARLNIDRGMTQARKSTDEIPMDGSFKDF